MPCSGPAARIPSISALPEHAEDCRRAAEFVAGELRRMGVEHVEVSETTGHPVVYGDWLHAEGAPTALVYGHYDVQPVDPLDLWQSPPFEPVVRDGRSSTSDQSTGDPVTCSARVTTAYSDAGRPRA